MKLLNKIRNEHIRKIRLIIHKYNYGYLTSTETLKLLSILSDKILEYVNEPKLLTILSNFTFPENNLWIINEQINELLNYLNKTNQHCYNEDLLATYAVLDQIKFWCENWLEKIHNLKKSFLKVRDKNITPFEIDILLYPEFKIIYNEFKTNIDKMIPYLNEDTYLSIEFPFFEGAEHVLCEEVAGCYKFGWDWEASFVEWINSCMKVLDFVSNFEKKYLG